MPVDTSNQVSVLEPVSIQADSCPSSYEDLEDEYVIHDVCI